jgi:hypothetical protein
MWMMDDNTMACNLLASGATDQPTCILQTQPGGDVGKVVACNMLASGALNKQDLRGAGAM